MTFNVYFCVLSPMHLFMCLSMLKDTSSIRERDKHNFYCRKNTPPLSVHIEEYPLSSSYFKIIYEVYILLYGLIFSLDVEI